MLLYNNVLVSFSFISRAYVHSCFYFFVPKLLPCNLKTNCIKYVSTTYGLHFYYRLSTYFSYIVMFRLVLLFFLFLTMNTKSTYTHHLIFWKCNYSVIFRYFALQKCEHNKSLWPSNKFTLRASMIHFRSFKFATVSVRHALLLYATTGRKRRESILVPGSCIFDPHM